uniref:Uncharacterized protein n=1 Tax=Lotharella vacuolata TaxID=74820 RepID=A0A0H5BH50_9EUKA|nr:hypothetical protein [Lotharella vacuolata]
MKIKNIFYFNEFKFFNYMCFFKHNIFIKLNINQKIYKIYKKYQFDWSFMIYFFIYLCKKKKFHFDLPNKIIINKNTFFKKINSNFIQIFFNREFIFFKNKNWFLNKTFLNTVRLSKNIKKFAHSNLDLDLGHITFNWGEFGNYNMKCRNIFKNSIKILFITNSTFHNNVIIYHFIKNLCYFP